MGVERPPSSPPAGVAGLALLPSSLRARLRAAFFRRRAERLELDLAIAQRRAEDQPPARHHVDGGELFGEIKRLVQRDQDDPRIEPQILGFAGQPRQNGELLQRLQRVGAVVGRLGDGCKTQLVGEFRLFDQLVKTLADILVRLIFTARGEPELHVRHGV